MTKSNLSSPSRRRLTIVVAACCVMVAALLAGAAEAQQTIAVPAYFYPGPLWTQMEDAAPTVGLAVVNPNSGPGASQDPNYVSQVASTQAAGIHVLGYVYTSYAARSAAAVEADIDLYYTWYGVDGIFLDEASNDCLMQPYYASLDSYVKSKGGAGVTVINPGTTTPECYISAADIILNFESTYSDYQAWTPQGWETNYDPSRFWHLIYGASEAEMANAVLLSQSRGAGWVYVTPDHLPNPWDTLPAEPYWSNELAYVRPGGSCTTPVVGPKVTLSRLATPPGDDRLAFSGQVTLPGNPTLDPVANGVRLIVTDAAGTIADITLPAGGYADPPGAGWKTNGSATKWTYTDTTGSAPGGIIKAVVEDRSAIAPGLFKFSLKGRDGAYPATAANLPITAVLLFDPATPSGPCARAVFPGPDPACAFNSSGATLKCR